MGSHLSLFLFYIFPYKHFFGFEFAPGNRPFLTPAIFYIDGWVMDGRAAKIEKNHVFSTFLKNYSIFFPRCFLAP